MKIDFKCFISRFYRGLTKHLLGRKSPQNRSPTAFMLVGYKDSIYARTR